MSNKKDPTCLLLAAILILISLATLPGCALRDPYNDGTLDFAIVRFGYFAEKLPPIGRRITESDLPRLIKQVTVQGMSRVYFVLALNIPRGDLTANISWFDPDGRLYQSDPKVMNPCISRCLWRWTSSFVFAEALVGRPGAWKVEVSIKGQPLGTYTLPTSSSSLTGGSPVPQKGFPLSTEGAMKAVRDGSAKEALNYYKYFAEKLETEGQAYNAGYTYLHAATVALYSGDYQKVIYYSEKSLGLSDDPALQYDAYLKFVLSYSEVGDFEKVRSFAGLMRDLAAANSWQRPLADSYRYLAWGEAGLREYDNAIENLLRAKQIYEKLISRSAGGTFIEVKNYFRCLSALGEASFGKRDMQQAKYYFRLLDTATRDRGKRPSMSARMGLGLIALEERDFDAAKQHLTVALRGWRQENRPIYIARALHGLARSYVALGHWNEGISLLKEAVNRLEDMRSSLNIGELRQTFLEGKMTVYSDLVLALQNIGDKIESFRYAERGRSRAFLDIVGTKVILSTGRAKAYAEEERTFQDRLAAVQVSADEEDQPAFEQIEAAKKAYGDFLAKLRVDNAEQASLMTVEPFGLNEVQALLDPTQTLVEYFLTPEKTFVWVVGQRYFHAFTVPTSQKDLTAKLNILRKSLSDIGRLADYQNAARDLNNLLIQPALPHIWGKELIIVPHDVLHYLPFQALYSSEGKYLIEDYSISYLSSASLLQFVKEKRRAAGAKALAFGNPDLGDPEKNLEFAELEVQEVKAAYPESTVYLRKEATEEKSKALSPNHDILHFATHAELNENDPLSSAVLLAREGKEDGRLEVREIFGMDLKANLVVLSGCETGLGKLSTGDELVGLTRAFIYAGTPSVVASLWKVDDSSTAHLMSSFYRNLKTMTKVEALRQAQLALIRGEGRSDLLARRGVGGIGKLGETPSSGLPAPSSVSTSHPYFWAPFILVGDGK